MVEAQKGHDGGKEGGTLTALSIHNNDNEYISIPEYKAFGQHCFSPCKGEGTPVIGPISAA